MILEKNNDFYLKTECFYLIKFDEVYGSLILKKDRLIFEPSNNLDYNSHLIK
jgi:hypothetical protein